ncbi:MAG: hypothetical protein AAGD96_15635 [Chloroflexota bacterium]
MNKVFPNTKLFGIGLIGLLLAFGFLRGVFQPTQVVYAQTNCSVSENYVEVIEENTFSMLKVLSWVNGDGSNLVTAEQFGSHYMLMVSMRNYHEQSQNTLPDCAQQLNQEMIQTISATQDAMTIMLAKSSFPEQKRNETRLEQTRNSLNRSWQELTAEIRNARLVGE